MAIKFDGGGYSRRKKRLGDILKDAGIVTEEQIEQALTYQKEKKPGNKLGASLIELGFITEQDIAKALQRQLGYEGVNLAGLKIPPEVLKVADEAILRKNNMMPFEFNVVNPNILRVAMSDPLDIMAVDDLAIVTGYQIEVVVATASDVRNALDRYYGNSATQKVVAEFTKEQEEKLAKRKEAEQANNDDVDQAPVVRIVNQIIEQGVRQRASDIHIEPNEDKMRVRYRIDGVLHETMRNDISLLSAISARIKIIGGMDISEKRKPQDGRIATVVDRLEYDIRVSILPTVEGEKIVMRLTQKKGLTRDKKDLGLQPEDLEKFEKIISHPNGIILVTGPTGSGKSTTLYTALSELNTEDVNIITVEDPVEANLAGINQVQVNAKAGMTFAAALRSILRQDPDIIMIGEIRDQETAEIAVQASITGHLVVSTLHTNSAASTITRLEDMGLESYLIADAVVGVIAQRLVRRVCPKCSREVLTDDKDKEILGMAYAEDAWIRRAVKSDCMHCGGTGYKGRVGVYEIMPMSHTLKVLVSSGANADEIEKQALKEGMKTLRLAAKEYVLQGITTVDELMRITYED
ncbi:MAG: ATPase, T2SS/T4P/T4SS family [Clostridiales bacterium]|nr:ATPase, T2SS/T4P/T4SS family [Clostridiales bacterium]